MTVPHSLYHDAGTPIIDDGTCTRCGACTRICPTEVLRLEGGRVVVHSESTFGCIACGHCMMVCPNGSVRVSGRGLSPDDLIPLPPAEARAERAALAALLQSRRSVRRFADTEPSTELLEEIVALAASGPMGIPPWDVGCVIVRGRQQVQQLAEEVVAGYAGLLKFMRPWLLTLLRPVMKRAAFEQMRDFILPLAVSYVDGRQQGRDLLFYDAPVLLLFHHSSYVEASEAMIACTQAMLVAEASGLGSTMIGAAAPIIARNPKLCRKLGIPEGHKPAIGLILGTPAVRFHHAIRRRFVAVNTIG